VASAGGGQEGPQVSLLEPVTERTRPLLCTGFYSPDGGTAADWDGRLVRIKQGGHEPIKVPGFDTVPDELHGSADGRTLVVAVSTGTCREVWAVDVASRERRRLWPRR